MKQSCQSFRTENENILKEKENKKWSKLKNMDKINFEKKIIIKEDHTFYRNKKNA